MSKQQRPLNPGDAADVAEMRRRAKDARKREAADFLEIMGTAAGRRFVWRLLSQAGVFHSSFTGNSETFFREGKRAIGLWVMSEIDALCPESYALMVRENQQQPVVEHEESDD